MKISNRGEYGLRAMINLGLAHELGRECVSATDLATADNLPLKFLEQIFLSLRQAGYVDTIRGKSGGYKLAKNPANITMGELVRLLDGPLAPIPCASKTAYEPCSCPDEDHCGLRMLMIDVRNAISNILDRYTLAQVVEVTLRKIRRNKAEHFFLRKEAPAPVRGPNHDPADPTQGFLAEWTSSDDNA